MRASCSSSQPLEKSVWLRRRRCTRTDWSFACAIATSASSPTASHVAAKRRYASAASTRWRRSRRAAALHSEQVETLGVIAADERSRVTQRAALIEIVSRLFELHAMCLTPLVAAATQRHQPIDRVPSDPSSFEHTSSVSVSLRRWHTPPNNGNKSCALPLYTSCRWAVPSRRTCVARTTSFASIREEQLVASRIVAHSIEVGILLTASDERLLREAPHELQTRRLTRGDRRCWCRRATRFSAISARRHEMRDELLVLRTVEYTELLPALKCHSYFVLFCCVTALLLFSSDSHSPHSTIQYNLNLRYTAG